MTAFLSTLEDILKQRKKDLPNHSYTTQLFKDGIDRILRKVGEESGEVIIAAKNNDSKELTEESADLLFHLMVLLTHQSLSINDVISVLEKRHQ